MGVEPRGRTPIGTSRVRAAKIRRQVVTMAYAGATTDAIAEAIGGGMTPKKVDRIIGEVCATWKDEERSQVDAVRSMSLARIDRLIQAQWSRAIGGAQPNGEIWAPSTAASAEIRRLEALKARIAGTEAAKKIDVSGELGLTIDQAELERMERAWARDGLEDAGLHDTGAIPDAEVVAELEPGEDAPDAAPPSAVELAAASLQP